MTSKLSEVSDFLGENYPPEIRSMMGIHVMFWRLEELMETLSEGMPLTKQERHMLVRLDEPKRMGVLAQQMAALPSTVTAVADALEERGLVLRERDPTDRRAWCVTLTKTGDRVRTDLLEEAGTAFAELSGLTKTEIERFAELVSKASIKILEHGIPEGMKSADC